MYGRSLSHIKIGLWACYNVKLFSTIFINRHLAILFQMFTLVTALRLLYTSSFSDYLTHFLPEKIININDKLLSAQKLMNGRETKLWQWLSLIFETL